VYFLVTMLLLAISTACIVILFIGSLWNRYPDESDTEDSKFSPTDKKDLP